MRPLENEPQIAAISVRLRHFLFRQPGFCASSFAEQVGANEREFRAILAPDRTLVDPITLIDVVVEAVRQYGVDANWVLTGDYDPAAHRILDEEGRLSGFELRRLVAERLPSWSPSRPTVKFPA
jgi:hypothetical protein